VPSSKAPACRGIIGLVCSCILTVWSGSLASVAGTAPSRNAALVRWTDSPPPPFTLDNLRKEPVSLADLRSDVLVVHFFATWCEPCREELPALRRLVERSDRARLRVVSVSVAEVDVRVRNFVDKVPVNFDILLDRDRAVTKSWNISALPTTVILDRDMKPRLFITHEYDWDNFDAAQALKMFGEQETATTGFNSVSQP
jgi:thiol-disulfide isomerase/thioredoxin